MCMPCVRSLQGKSVNAQAVAETDQWQIFEEYCLQWCCSRVTWKLYAGEAIRLFQERVNYPSLETVQGAVLLGHLVGGEGDAQAKQAYIGIARTHAEVLSLWAMPPNSTVVHREERRRTWLSIRIADPWTIIDMSVNSGASLQNLNVLPEVDDVAFHTYDPELLREVPVPSSSRCDMWAQMAGTLDIYTRISVLLTRLSRGVIAFDAYLSEVPLLKECLDGWVRGLPPTLAYSSKNLAFFAKQGLGRNFLAMHIVYHISDKCFSFPLWMHEQFGMQHLLQTALLNAGKAPMRSLKSLTAPQRRTIASSTTSFTGTWPSSALVSTCRF